MPRRPSTNSPAPSLDLHPVLQTTLHCMDVRLEDELTRYRRARRRSPVQSRWGDGQPIVPPEAKAVEAAPMEVAALAIAPNLAATLQSEPEPPAPVAPEPPAVPFIPPQAEGYPDYLESSEHLLRSLAEDEAELRTEPNPRMMDTLLTPLGVGSMVLLLLSSVTLGYIITNPTGLPFISAKAPADDAGTAVSTAPDATTAAQEPNSFYPDLSSQEFRDLNLDTLSTIPEDGTADTTTPAPPTINPSASATTPRPQPAPPAANSSIQTPRTASAPASRPASSPQRSASAPSSRSATTPSRPANRPSPAASPRPASRPSTAARPAARPAAPAPTASRPAPSPSRSPSVSRSAPSRSAPSRSTPTTVAAAPSRPTTYYYVVTDYTGDRSLAAARQAVGDAYVRNFEIGAVVQFGAFQEQGRAQSLLQDLQQQGIQARIYRAESN